MPKERYYTQETLQEGSSILLQGDEFHHLSHVMRQREGEKVELINGSGILASASICTLRHHSATLQITSVSSQSPPPLSLVLVQALSPSNRLEDVLEKGTELGADAFWFFGAEKGKQAILSPSRQRRFEKIVLAATKQSGRLYLPALCFLPNLSFLLRNVPQTATLLFGHIYSSEPNLLSLSTASLFQPETTHLFFCTGPESGWSSQELQILAAHKAKAVQLNAHTLRMETAAITAAAFLNFLIGKELKK